MISDPFWYKNAIIYQLHVKCFYDSDGDGIGDFNGLMQKLPYLAKLGITAIWLLPFYPSPLKDDGYDIADYYSVHPDYGTVKDFKKFLKEAHQLGLKVITELVVNHTSDQHPFFQRSRKAKPASKYRNYYVWSDSPDKFSEARIIFKDFENSNWTYDPVAKAYFWHRFYSHQPDLNYENPFVQQEILKVLDFWFKIGVDGMRLDAVPYLFEKEGTNCENLPETHQFLKKLRKYVEKKYPDRMLLAEANQWPEDAVAYFGQDDECHMAFHFPVMPRLFMSIQTEDRFPILDILEQTPLPPPKCQWAIFLRNHDELTLEMVTDEERDYMYRVYAKDPKAIINLGIRRRLAPLLENNRDKIELMNILLFSLPGTPIIYYGDEIGMGDNYYLGDRNGVRTPMQWSADRNAGFSQANPQKLYLPLVIDPAYHYETLNVENQESNISSLLWWMRRTLLVRKKFKAFGEGSFNVLSPTNSKVLVFTRKYDDEVILVIGNLSRFSQAVELNLNEYAGWIPQELFSQAPFPSIKDTPYRITLGPFGYYWFSLIKEQTAIPQKPAVQVPSLKIYSHDWKSVIKGISKMAFQKILPEFLMGRRWFNGKGKKIQNVEIIDTIPFFSAEMTLILVNYYDNTPETYFLPIMFSLKEKTKLHENTPIAIIANLNLENGEGVLYDAHYDPSFQQHLLSFASEKSNRKGDTGELISCPNKKNHIKKKEPFTSKILSSEQSNTGINFQENLYWKSFRRLDIGLNPDVEIEKILTEKNFQNIPKYLSHINWVQKGMPPMTLGILEEFMAGTIDSWIYTSDSLKKYYEQALSQMEPFNSEKVPGLVGNVYEEFVRNLGRSLAKLHIALATASDEPDFKPEPFTALYQRSLYQSMRNLTRQVFSTLNKAKKDLSEDLKDLSQKVLDKEQEILNIFHKEIEIRFQSLRIRIHGDLHLGQILYTGKDFIFIDFEGEVTRSISERKLKRSPLKDIAGMIRSFHYVTYVTLYHFLLVQHQEIPKIEQWAEQWFRHVSSIFLEEYLKYPSLKEFKLIPENPEELNTLLKILTLEKVIYELGYEINQRPEWIKIPLKGILYHLENPF